MLYYLYKQIFILYVIFARLRGENKGFVSYIIVCSRLLDFSSGQTYPVKK